MRGLTRDDGGALLEVEIGAMNEEATLALAERVRAYIDEDPDEGTKAELQALLDEGAWDDLQSRFDGRLQFGTAGLRGLLGGGPMRMNRVTVLRATAGLCREMLRSVPNAKERGLVIGYDARRMSEELARDAAEVASGHGIVARLFSAPVPTPVAGFAVLELNAAAGVVITASHNPPDYNGYKVFWENGAQIIPPVDEAIADSIDAVGALATIERSDAHIRQLNDGLPNQYLERAAAVLNPVTKERATVVAYTAMHGVGGKYIGAAFKRAGFTLFGEPSQAEPDGRFPTVAFPNPEEDGAMDRVLELAAKENADLVLANDPDADRLAAAVRHGGEYRLLTGNEIGCLLAHHILERGSGDERTILSSVVSSPMLYAIGQSQGVHAEQTLTGHKWIQNRALDLAKDGRRVVFGYEEALGYAVSPMVRDKDGITAALLLAEMADELHAQGQTLIDALETMARRYGLFLSDQVSVVLPGAEGQSQIAARMKALRQTPPAELGGFAVLAHQDFESGKRISGNESTELTFPASNVLLFELEGGHRAMVRPSGTEPKIKHYIDVRVDLAEGESIDAGRERGLATLSAIRDAFVS
ncbi:MAG: phospho-sugar mutase [Myxococcota bacterium]